MFAPLKQRDFLAQLPPQERDRAIGSRTRCLPRDLASIRAVFGPRATLLTPKVLGRLDMSEAYYCFVDGSYVGATLELTKQQRLGRMSIVRFITRDILTHTVTAVIDRTHILELCRFLLSEDETYYYGTAPRGDPIYIFVHLRDVCRAEGAEADDLLEEAEEEAEEEAGEAEKEAA
jgi:hypothetical protein